MKKYLCLTFLALVFLVSFFPARAQEEKSGFSITPFFQEISIGSDQEKIKFDFTLSNDTDEPAVFFLSVLDFGALDESGGVAFLGASGDFEKKYGLASWISLEKDAVAIAPHEKQVISATVENRESLSPGGHYAAVLFKIDNDSNIGENEPSRVSFKPSFASLIFVRKAGGEMFGLELKGREWSRRLLALPSKISLRFQNSGNVHNIPRGIVRIEDPFGREVGKGIINSESGIILPETFKIFPVPIKNIKTAFIPGKYRVTIEYRYDGRETFELEQFSIFVIPLADWLAVLMLITIGGLIYKTGLWKKFHEGRKLNNGKSNAGE